MKKSKSSIKSYTYEVALSFAGEDRELAKQVADNLRTSGIRVFYDEYERANLWGKELIEYLEDVFKNKSKFVIIFVSKAYLTKDWTNHERKSALNRAFTSKEEYILPIRLDDSKLPGLHDSIGYLDAKQLSPIEICNIFLDKIGKMTSSVIQSSLLLYRITRDKYSKDLSGQGASIVGGRWNKKGTSLLYASTSLPLAVLETSVHLIKDLNIRDFVVVQYVIPSNMHIDTIYESDLPSNWKDIPHNSFTQEFGTEWIEKEETCILSVPSVILPSERNFLLNPNHNNYKHLTINKIDPIAFDIDYSISI